MALTPSSISVSSRRSTVDVIVTSVGLLDAHPRRFEAAIIGESCRLA